MRLEDALLELPPFRRPHELVEIDSEHRDFAGRAHVQIEHVVLHFRRIAIPFDNAVGCYVTTFPLDIARQRRPFDVAAADGLPVSPLRLASLFPPGYLALPIPP